MGSSIETAVRYSRKFESILENRFGALGKGLHEKINHIEGKLPPDTIRKLRKIATIRNRVVHEDGYEINDLDHFTHLCDELLFELDPIRKQQLKVLSQTYSYPIFPYIIFLIALAVFFHFYGEKVYSLIK